MRRRAFIAGLGGAVAFLLPARAQQAMPVVGLLRSTPSAPFGHLVKALRQGLNEAGFVEGRNLVIEQRWAEGRSDRLTAFAAELIKSNVAVIVANNIAMPALIAATKTVPIVFATGSDPVRDGLIASLNRPGGNITGVSFLTGILGTKRLEIMRHTVPKASSIAMLVYPNSPESEAERSQVLAAAKSIGQPLIVAEASSSADIEKAFATFALRGANGLIVGTGGYLNSRREEIVALAARHALPAIYPLRESVVLGGLMSYGSSQNEAYRQAGVYAGRILKGEKPGDLPVIQSSKFEFVINLKTAKTLGLEFHPQLLATADEVIE